MLFAPFRLLRNLWSLFWHLISLAFFKLGRGGQGSDRVYLEFDLKGTMNLENQEPRGLGRWLGDNDAPNHTLLQWREWVDVIVEDEKVGGVILRVNDFAIGSAYLGDFIQMLFRLKEAKKKVIVHVQGGDLRTLRLLASADSALMTPAGRLYTFGLRFDQMFAHELLSTLGVEAQFIHIGAFKTATHTYHKAHPTAPQNAMMQALFDGFTQFNTRQICTLRPHILPRAIEEMLAKAPIEGAHAAHLGILDGLVFVDQIEAWLNSPSPKEPPRVNVPARLTQVASSVREHESKLKPKKKKKRKKKQQEAGQISAIPGESFVEGHPSRWAWKPVLGRKSYMAVLDLQGAIVMGAQGGLPLGGRGPSIKAEEVIPVLNSLLNDSRCKGLLLHINSPGGSAIASDLMWHHLTTFRQSKPVVAYCSDVAASGGYYLACAADRIIARRSTITGSIGVIVGKISGKEALEKLKVSVNSIYNEDNALFTSLYHPLSQDSMQNLRDDARGFYRRFLDRVGMARGIERGRLHRYARGRVYLGTDAHRRGLVDDLGGLERAIAVLYELGKGSESEIPLRYVEHHKQGLREVISGSIQAESPVPRAVTQAMQMAQWLKEEPILALMPWRVES